jgi:hypothetical protein
VAADSPATSRRIARVHPMTAGGPVPAGGLRTREAIADPRVQPVVVGSAVTSTGPAGPAGIALAAGRVATGRSAAVARISAATGKAGTDRSAVAGRAVAIGRSATTAKAEATVISAETGQPAAGRVTGHRAAVAGHRVAAARHRAAAGLATTVLRTVGAVPGALATTGSRVTTGRREAEVALGVLATKGRRAAAAVVRTIAAGQRVRAGLGPAADRAVLVALELPGERMRAAAIAARLESMRAGPRLTRCRSTFPRASPQTS